MVMNAWKAILSFLTFSLCQTARLSLTPEGQLSSNQMLRNIICNNASYNE